MLSSLNCDFNFPGSSITSDYGYIKGSWVYISIFTRFNGMLRWACYQHREIQAFPSCCEFDKEPNKKLLELKSCWRYSPLTSFIIKDNTIFHCGRNQAIYATSFDTDTMQMTALQHLENSLENLCLWKMMNRKYVSLGNADNSKGSCRTQHNSYMWI